MLTLHYEARFGLARGAVYKDGLPHLYMQGYEHDPSPAVLGTRSVARFRTTGGGVAFVELVGGGDAVLDMPQGIRLVEGGSIEVGIIAEGRRDKLPRARYLGPAEGAPRRLSPVLDLKARLLAQAATIFGDMPVKAVEADDDLLLAARDEAVQTTRKLSGGGYLIVEQTSALIACDIDAGTMGGGKASRACNERAVADLPRRLRLSGLAGLVVVDLIGRRHDGERLRGLLLKAFGAEAPQVIVAPIGRFGTLEFVRPWSTCPVIDSIDNDTGAAFRLLWEAARTARGQPGRQLILKAPVAILDVIRPLLATSLDPLTPLLRLEAGDLSEVVVL